MSEVHNPILGYADSYRLMVRMAEKEGKPLVVSMWSVITDLERNMAPLFSSAQSELAALREELYQAKEARDREMLAGVLLQRDLVAAEQRNVELVGAVRSMLDDSGHDAMTGEICIMRSDYESLCALTKPTESGTSEPEYIGLNVCNSCSGRFGEFKTCSNSLLGKAYYVECASCCARTSGHDKAASAVREWNSISKQESGASE